MNESLTIPGYDILRELGRGGMATVYLAVQRSFDREVALKVMSPLLNSDPSFATRFMREARIVAHIHHSSIVPVFDVGDADPYHYMSMEFLPSGDLKQRILDGHHGPDLAFKVCMPIASALDIAHRKGFVHRDLKPENILFREDGTAVLTDFGIARAIDPGASLTIAGTFVGTPSYMSPEQVKGLEVDGRSDLYSLGIVFYEMLTGDVPFRADSSFSIAMKQVAEPLPRLPADLSAYQSFLDRMTAKDAAQRFATGAEVLHALQQIGIVRVPKFVATQHDAAVPEHGETLLRSRESVATTPPVRAQASPPARRRAPPLASKIANTRFSPALLGVLAVVGLTVWFALPKREAPVETQSAPSEPQAATQIAPAVETPVVPAEDRERAARVAAETRSVAEAETARKAAEALHHQQEVEKAAREAQAGQLLAAAKDYLAAGALFEPDRANAVDNYRAALKLLPRSLEAAAGMKQVGDIIAAEAVQSKSAGNRESLKVQIEQLRSVQPAHSLLDHLRRELKRLETTPVTLDTEAKTNLDKAVKMVAKINNDLNRKRATFSDAESASEQYDKAAALAPFSPGLPLLKARITAFYAAVAQTSLNESDPKRALRMINYAHQRTWFSPELGQIELLAKQRVPN